MNYNFEKVTDLSSWHIIDDAVMGGKSWGKLSLNAAGHVLFHGRVLLDNNGGFSLIRHQLSAMDVSRYSKFVICLKGDGKRYQFRIKDKVDHSYAYVSYFDTSTFWEEIEIQFTEMYPMFRGQTVNLPNYPGNVIEEIGFLIGNKQPENFSLEIDRIYTK